MSQRDSSCYDGEFVLAVSHGGYASIWTYSDKTFRWAANQACAGSTYKATQGSQCYSAAT